MDTIPAISRTANLEYAIGGRRVPKLLSFSCGQPNHAFTDRGSSPKKASRDFSSHMWLGVGERVAEIWVGNPNDPFGYSTITTRQRGPRTPSHQFQPNVCPTTTHTHPTIAGVHFQIHIIPKTTLKCSRSVRSRLRATAARQKRHPRNFPFGFSRSQWCL